MAFPRARQRAARARQCGAARHAWQVAYLGLAQPRLKLGNGGRGAVALLCEPCHLPREFRVLTAAKGRKGQTAHSHCGMHVSSLQPADRAQPLLCARVCEGSAVVTTARRSGRDWATRTILCEAELLRPTSALAV
jgi:hypothetical protein